MRVRILFLTRHRRQRRGTTSRSPYVGNYSNRRNCSGRPQQTVETNTNQVSCVGATLKHGANTAVITGHPSRTKPNVCYQCFTNGYMSCVVGCQDISLLLKHAMFSVPAVKKTTPTLPKKVERCCLELRGPLNFIS